MSTTPATDASTGAMTAVQALRIVDFGLGLSAALIVKQFAELGAQVSRIEPAGGDPFYEVYPAYRLWRRRATLETPDHAAALFEKADVCIVGGEDFPGLAPAADAQELAARYPRLVILRLVGYPADGKRPRPAVDLLVQARTGVVYEQFSRRPVVRLCETINETYYSAFDILSGCKNERANCD